jgi:DNA-binding MarR family transcriptional regulator
MDVTTAPAATVATVARATDPFARVVDEVMRDCLMTRSRRLSRVVTHLFDQELRPFGMSASQFSLLVLIATLDGASRAEIGRANCLERSTSTRNLQLMLDEGWIEEVLPARGRSRPIVVSSTGRSLLAQAMPAWRNAQQHAVRLLGEEGAIALAHLCAGLPVENVAA